jgi:excisionase family DNA binding protein
MPSMPTDAAPEAPLTPSEAAILLRVSAATIYRLVRTGDLPGVHIAGPGSSIRIPAAAIDELLARR